MEPKFSVVVNCFNRREFVKDALNSACLQSIKRSQYEILLIKNFYDSDIDSFLDENDIKSIYAQETTTGSWFEIAANIAKGDFIVFLDDDDLMHPNKLEILQSTINIDPKIVYIHNNSEKSNSTFWPIEFEKMKITEININSDSQFRKALKKRYYFNLSSITIKREIIVDWLSFIRETNHGTDFVMFFSAILSGEKMIDYDDYLTFYRIHPSSHGNFKAKGIEEFENEKQKVLPSYLKNWEIYSSFTNSDILVKYAKVRLTTTKIWLNLISSSIIYKVNFSELIENISGLTLYPNYILFIMIYYFDRLFHRATRKIYYMIIYSWVGWKLRENT